MLINMRNGLMAGGGLSAKSYIKDGLIAMWDGIENAGWGVHDANATVWKNLAADRPDAWPDIRRFSGTSGMTWEDDGLVVTLNDAYCSDKGNFIGDVTCEVVCEVTDVQVPNNSNAGYIRICSCMEGGGFSIYSPKATSLSLIKNVCFQSYGTDAYNDSAWCNDAFSPRMSISGSSSSTETVCRVNDVIHSVPSRRMSKSGSRYFALGYDPFGDGRVDLIYSGRIAGVFNRVSIYSRALTAAEIAANYAVDKARFNLPDA